MNRIKLVGFLSSSFFALLILGACSGTPSTAGKKAEPSQTVSLSQTAGSTARPVKFAHGDTPTLKDLQSHSWYSVTGMQNARFDSTRVTYTRPQSAGGSASFSNDIISSWPYSVNGNIIHFDMTPYHGVDDEYVMSWKGDALIFTPNDSLSHKEERSKEFRATT